MKTMKNILLSVIAAASLLNAGGDITPVIEDVQAEESTWNNEFQLYGLAVWIKGNSAIGYRLDNLSYENSTPSANIDVGPDDIVKNLKMGLMAHYEGHHNSGWGIWLDYVFMNLGPDVDSPVELLDVNNLGVYQGIMEAFVEYRVPLESGYVDYYGGVRWWHNSFDITLSALGQTKSWNRTIDWYDPVLGARWTVPINENWSFRARADVGGFGISSDFTAAIELGTLYDINENWQVDLRFKSLWVDYEEGTEGTQDYFAYDTANFGPIIGITYKF